MNLQRLLIPWSLSIPFLSKAVENAFVPVIKMVFCGIEVRHQKIIMFTTLILLCKHVLHPNKAKKDLDNFRMCLIDLIPE